MTEEVLLLLYLGWLAASDLKRKSLPLPLLLVGTAFGLLFRFLSLRSGELAPDQLAALYLPGLFFGMLFLAVSRFAPAAVGRGDGLFLLSMAFILPAGELFLLLLGSLCACAVFGLILMAVKKKKRSFSLPFLPFVLLCEIIRLLKYM